MNQKLSTNTTNLDLSWASTRRKQRKRISEINDGHRRRDIEKIVKIYKQQQVYKGDKIHRDKCKAFVLHFDGGQLFGQSSGNF